MMQNDNQKSAQQQQRVEQKPQRANEAAGLNIDEHVKISDPNTQEVYLEKRA